MKTYRLIVLSLLTLLLAANVPAQSVQWQSIEQAAAIDASANKKMFFIDFSTSWCGWCKKMDRETFADPVVAAILNRYYIPVQFNAEGNSAFTWNGTAYQGAAQNTNGRPGTHSFTRAVLGKQIGYPSFAIFNKGRGLIQLLQGYYPAYDFSMVLWYFANGDNTRYDFEEYRQIFATEIKPDMMKKLGL